MILGEGQLISGRAFVYNLASGVGSASRALYDFIANGYTDTQPCDDDAKGSLKLYATQVGATVGNTVQLYVDGVPVDASAGIPLKVYAVDPTEPYIRHTGPVNAGTFNMRIQFVHTGGPPKITDEWQETWTQ